MSKDAVSDWDTVAANNTDVGGTNIDENCSPAGINDALREIMSQIKELDPPGSAASETITGTWDMSGATLTMPTQLEVLNSSSITGLSGSDVSLITGTAGTDGYVSTWNADGDLVDGYEVPDDNDLSNTGAGLARRDNVLAAMQEVEVKDETLSNASEFTATVTGYSFYKVYLEAIVPATDGAELRLRTSSTGGAPWDSGGSDYAHALIVQRVGSAVSESKSSGTTTIPLTGGIGNDTGEMAHGTLEIVGAAGSTPTNVYSNISYLNDSGSFRRYSGDSWRLASSAVTAIRIYMSTGNFSGRIVVKGIR